MQPKQILAAYLILVAGLLLAAALASSSTSLAEGPPPTGTPGPVKSSYPFPQGLIVQPISSSVRAAPMRLDPSNLSLPQAPPVELTISSNGGWQKNVTQTFDGPFPTAGWILNDESSTDGGQYLWGKRTCRALSGSYSMWAGGGGVNGATLPCVTYTNNLTTWLKYGPVDLSQVTDAELQSAMWGDTEAIILGDILIPFDLFFFGVSTNGIDFLGYSTGGSTGDWMPLSLDLGDDSGVGNYAGQPAVYFAWAFVSDNSNPAAYKGTFIDNAALWTYTAPPPTPPPPAPTLPITRHTTITDFRRGRSADITVSGISGGGYGDGALTPSTQITDIGPWQHLPSLPGAELYRFGAVTAKEHLFITGGVSADYVLGQRKYERRVYSALIYEDGSLGHWVEINPLPQALSDHATVVSNDHLFVLGGFNINGVQRDVFSASINDDGTLGSWVRLADLPKPLWVHTAVATHGYIYVLGGSETVDTTPVFDTVYRAAVNANGTLGNWELLPVRLPGPRRLHATVAACDRLYLIAGADEFYEWEHVYQAPIHSDGSLGAWSQTTSLPKSLSVPAAVATRGGILVTGGWNSFNPVFSTQKSVYWAPLDSNCALSNWIELSPLPYSMYVHALVATDRYVYNLGGTNAALRTFDSVLVASLQGSSNPVQRGSFNHQFHLGNNYTIKALHWTEEGSGSTQVSLRYRVGATGSGGYGPWSSYSSTNPLPINALGGYLEYELKFEGGSGPSNRRVSEVNLTITEPPSIYLPLLLK